VNGGHEDYGEERADIEDQQLLLDGPGESEQKQDDEGEDDVAAD
jgi:hypothetical protein